MLHSIARAPLFKLSLQPRDFHRGDVDRLLQALILSHIPEDALGTGDLAFSVLNRHLGRPDVKRLSSGVLVFLVDLESLSCRHDPFVIAAVLFGE